MYHYVRDPETFKGSVPVSKEKFRWQMEQLSRKYEIVSPDDLSKSSNKNRCVITFDDGTKDQYTNAYQVLKEMGLPGYFTVMSGPLIDKEVPIFHLVHNLLSEFSDDEIWEEIQSYVTLSDITAANDIYSYESNIKRRYIKYLLNFVWSSKESKKYISNKFKEKYNNKEKFINHFYITEDEFKEMYNNGMTIGVHANKHRGFSGQGLKFFKEEIKPCIDFMQNNLNIKPHWYTPAFGGGENKDSMRKELKEILIHNGIQGAFTTNEGIIEGIDSYWLNRFDCNQFYKVLNLV